MIEHTKMNGSVAAYEKFSRKTSRHSNDEMKVYQEMMAESMLSEGSSRINKALHAVVENKLHETALSESNNSVLERNRALLQYIATLADSNKKNDHFNYEFVESLVQGGAGINIADQHGQSIFHEVARSWNVDVAKFLLQHGGDINKTDSFGRTPLHVAVSVDFDKMAEFLLQNNADIDARTLGELQAPVHYAAKNGAVRSLKLLLGYQANIDSLDYRQRTPLQLAAEWSRDKTAKLLIDEGASSCLLDTSGNSALSVLIDRLPHLSLEALNQLHVTDVITMKEFYYINLLEASRMNLETKKTRTPLETAVVTRRFEVVSHPVMQRLIENKWMYFGKTATILDLSFFIVFNVLWTTMSMLTPPTGQELYDPLSENIWRVVLLAVIGVMIIYQVGRQVRATLKTVRAKKHWIKWQTEKLQEDLTYCHPRWPQEAKAIKYEIKRIKKLKRFSAEDGWFYYDWLVLIVMIAALAMHIVYYKVANDDIRNVYTRILSVANLIVSLRLLEIVRPFPGIGTLVIILGETSGDFMNWAFLFVLLLVPFSASFWIIFGSLSLQPVTEFDDTASLLYSVLRMAVGDDFNLDGLVEAEPVMARILTVIYLTAMTIVTLNLLIALLSDTFTRVHGNAIANTIMQRAIKVIEAERALTKKKKLNYREHVKLNCSPEIIDCAVDVADPESTASSKELIINLTTLKQLLDDRFAKVFGKNKISDFDKLKNDISKIKESQRKDYDNLNAILRMLKQQLQESGPKDKIPLQKETKIQIPGLSVFTENIHWLSDGVKKRDKRRKKKLREHKEHKKAGHKRKDKNRENPETPIAPNYHGVNSSNRVENDDRSQGNMSDDLEGWDTVSLGSISL